MAQSGIITVGSHTARHRILTTLDEDEIHNELVESKEKLIAEHSGQLKVYEKEQEVSVTKELLLRMSAEKQEGEKNADFEKRVKEEIDKVLAV